MREFVDVVNCTFTMESKGARPPSQGEMGELLMDAFPGVALISGREFEISGSPGQYKLTEIKGRH